MSHALGIRRLGNHDPALSLPDYATAGAAGLDLRACLAPDDRGRVFEPFRTAGERCGTGLGLPICRRIVEAHGGRMWIEDGDDGGTAVVFTLRSSRP